MYIYLYIREESEQSDQFSYCSVLMFPTS